MTAVDVVVPLFNKAPVIARTLRSVFAQTCRDLRLTVVDDGSTDDGAAVVEAEADPRVRLVRQANAGVGPARNRGLREGAAEFVAFLDADDEWLPGFLDAGLDALRRHPECVFAVTAVRWGADETIRAPWHPLTGAAEGPWRCPTTIAFPALKAAIDSCHTGAIVARRAAVEARGGFYDRRPCTYAEDSFLWSQLVMAGPIARIARPLARYNIEDSVLGVGRRTPYPRPPLLDHADEVVARCPPSHRPTFRRYLEQYRAFVVRRMIRQGSFREAFRALPPLAEARRLSRAALGTYASAARAVPRGLLTARDRHAG